jgi:hypothetical protein
MADKQRKIGSFGEGSHGNDKQAELARLGRVNLFQRGWTRDMAKARGQPGRLSYNVEGSGMNRRARLFNAAELVHYFVKDYFSYDSADVRGYTGNCYFP